MSKQSRAVYGSRFSAQRALAYNTVERMLKRYDEIVLAVNDARADSKRSQITGGSGTAHISDPTAATAIRHLTPLAIVELIDGCKVHKPETWLAIINRAYRDFPPIESRAMRHFYSGKTATWTAVTFGMDESTVYRIRADFRQYLVELACQYDLVRVAPAE